MFHLWTAPSDHTGGRAARNAHTDVYLDKWKKCHLIKGADFVSALYTIQMVHSLPQISINKELFG